MGKGGIRHCNYKNHRIFTFRYISKGLVPVSVNLTTNRKNLSVGARKILKRAERHCYRIELNA